MTYTAGLVGTIVVLKCVAGDRVYRRTHQFSWNHSGIEIRVYGQVQKTHLLFSWNHSGIEISQEETQLKLDLEFSWNHSGIEIYK